ANCLVVVHNNSTSLKIANLTPVRQIIHKGQRVTDLDPWYGQWTTPSTGILDPQQHHQLAVKINDYINQTCASVTDSVNVVDSDGYAISNEAEMSNGVTNIGNNYQQNKIDNNKMNEYSCVSDKNTTRPISTTSHQKLILEPPKPVINKEGLIKVGTNIGIYKRKYELKEKRREGEDESENENDSDNEDEQDTYVFGVKDFTKDNKNAPSLLSAQTPLSEDCDIQILKALDLSSAKLNPEEEKLLMKLILKYSDLFASKLLTLPAAKSSNS
ncbi:unnamed protein product, partial [Didymodactylos carnosus]